MVTETMPQGLNVRHLVSKAIARDPSHCFPEVVCVILIAHLNNLIFDRFLSPHQTKQLKMHPRHLHVHTHSFSPFLSLSPYMCHVCVCV